MSLALHTLSAIGGVFGLWIVARSFRESWRGARDGIRGHTLKCDHCGKTIFWAGCTRDR